MPEKLPIERHSTRQPPSVTQILAEQKAFAEKQTANVKANLPTTRPAAAPLPAADSRTPAEQYVAGNSASFMPGPLITFNGKTGVFNVASTKEEVSPQRKFAALLSSTWAGYIMFPDDGGPPERWGGLLYEPGFVFPNRASLGHLDQSAWPTGLNNERSDPLQHQLLFPIADTETQELFCFGTVSKTGRAAVSRLLSAYNRKIRSGYDELPIVQLVPSSYPSKRGPVPIPSFPILTWTKADSTPRTLDEDLDDEIPFS
jgi:hypothetical protein